MYPFFQFKVTLERINTIAAFTCSQFNLVKLEFFNTPLWKYLTIKKSVLLLTGIWAYFHVLNDKNNSAVKYYC